MKLTQRKVAPRSSYTGPWGAGTKVPGMSDPMVTSGPVTKRYDAAIYLESDPDKRHALAAKFQGVLRMQIRKQPISSGGVRGPCMIIRGQAGPTSNRMSKGVHKKSGSARGNLCHLAGRHVTHEGKRIENAMVAQYLDILRDRHCKLIWMNLHQPDSRKLEVMLKTYQYLHDRFVRLYPEYVPQIRRMEVAHRACMQ